MSQPEERVGRTRLGLGSMLAVEEERRERAVRVLMFSCGGEGRGEWEGVCTVVCDGVGACHCDGVWDMRGGVCLCLVTFSVVMFAGSFR